MSWPKFVEAFKEKFPEEHVVKEDVVEWIEDYIKENKKEYRDNRDSGKLTFGKYKGYEISELAQTEKGKDYLQWLMAQSFFSEDKFTCYHNKLKELGIKKKKNKDPEEKKPEKEHKERKERKEKKEKRETHSE
jgi:uncharacterized protein (DUF3820 family)